MPFQPLPGLLDVFCLIVDEKVPEIILLEPALSRNAVFKRVHNIALARDVCAKNEFFILRHECEHFPHVYLAWPRLLDLCVKLRCSPKNSWALRSQLDSPLEAIFCFFDASQTQQRFSNIAPSNGRRDIAPQGFLQIGQREGFVLRITGSKTIR